LLAFTSCSKPQQSAIIGRWHEVGTSGSEALYEDGTVEVSDGQSVVSGKYSFITNSKLKIEAPGKAGATTTRVFEIVFASDKMSWKATDVDGLKSEYLKAK
jgi:hypothetical protein